MAVPYVYGEKRKPRGRSSVDERRAPFSKSGCPIRGEEEAKNTSRPVDARLYGRLEKTQAYNLSLGASTHDIMVTVTSTRRASIADMRSGKGQGYYFQFSSDLCNFLIHLLPLLLV